ncbi:hypothetical protein [Streptomyces sp. NPDC001978]
MRPDADSTGSITCEHGPMLSKLRDLPFDKELLYPLSYKHFKL